MALIDRLPQPLPLLHLISQKITFFKDDFRVENWILCGALLQSLLFYLHPHSSAAYIPLILLTIQQLWAFLIYTRVVPNRQSEGVLAGRVTAQVPNDDGTTNEEAGGKDIVVFVLGVRSTDPLGRMVPGFSEIGKMFRAMFADVSDNRVKYGYLGKTPTMVTTDDPHTNTMVWITYWRDITSLRSFAYGPSHRAAWDFYIQKKFTNIGIMHETYHVPAKHWENIYINFKPFGFGSTGFVVSTKQEDGTKQEDYISGLRYAKGKEWKSMLSRMGRDEVDTSKIPPPADATESTTENEVEVAS